MMKIDVNQKELDILLDLVLIEYNTTNTQLEEAYDNPRMRSYFHERLDKLEDLLPKLGETDDADND